MARMDEEIALQLGQPPQGIPHGSGVAAGQVCPAAGAGEEGVPGKHMRIYEQTYGSGGVAWGFQHQGIHSGKGHPVAIGIGVGIVKGSRRQHGGQGQLLGVQIDPAAGLRRQVPDSPHVVKVAVGQSNDGKLQALLFEKGQNDLRLIARVDDQTLLGPFRPDNVAVGLVVSQWEGVNLKHTHTPLRLTAYPFGRWYTLHSSSCGQCPSYRLPGCLLRRLRPLSAGP